MGSITKQKVLITGGAGFIGTHLAERLADDNQIILFDSFRRDSLAFAPKLKTHPNVTIVTGDVLDPGSIAQALDGVDTVVHLAAIAGVSSYYKQPVMTLRVNIQGTFNLLAEMGRRKIERYVYFSTSEVFGPNALWVEENSPHALGPVTDPRWVYATSKLTGEHISLRHAEEQGFSCAIVRPFNIYGPRQIGEGAIANFCRAIAKGEPITIYDDGSAIRAWCYVSDMVDAVCSILAKRFTTGQVFNIGNPTAVETTIGLMQRMRRLEPNVVVNYVNSNRTDVRVRIPTITAARTTIGFEPKIDLDEGLRRTLEWFKENREELV